MLAKKLPLLAKRGWPLARGVRRLFILTPSPFGYSLLQKRESSLYKGYFKENTALSKAQATAAVKGAEKSVKVFLRAVAQLNFHTPA